MTFQEFQSSRTTSGKQFNYTFPEAPFEPVILDNDFALDIPAVGWSHSKDKPFDEESLIFAEWVLFGYLTGALEVSYE